MSKATVLANLLKTGKLKYGDLTPDDKAAYDAFAGFAGLSTPKTLAPLPAQGFSSVMKPAETPTTIHNLLRKMTPAPVSTPAPRTVRGGFEPVDTPVYKSPTPIQLKGGYEPIGTAPVRPLAQPAYDERGKVSTSAMLYQPPHEGGPVEMQKMPGPVPSATPYYDKKNDMAMQQLLSPTQAARELQAGATEPFTRNARFTLQGADKMTPQEKVEYENLWENQSPAYAHKYYLKLYPTLGSRAIADTSDFTLQNVRAADQGLQSGLASGKKLMDNFTRAHGGEVNTPAIMDASRQATIDSADAMGQQVQTNNAKLGTPGTIMGGAIQGAYQMIPTIAAGAVASVMAPELAAVGLTVGGGALATKMGTAVAAMKQALPWVKKAPAWAKSLSKGTKAARTVGSAVFAHQAFGSYAHQSELDQMAEYGYVDVDRQMAAALLNSAGEVLMENVLFFPRILRTADDGVRRQFTKSLFQNYRKVSGEMLKGFLGEFTEEALMEPFNNVVANSLYGSDKQVFVAEDMLMSGLIGGIMGVSLSAGPGLLDAVAAKGIASDVSKFQSTEMPVIIADILQNAPEGGLAYTVATEIQRLGKNLTVEQAAKLKEFAVHEATAPVSASKDSLIKTYEALKEDPNLTPEARQSLDDSIELLVSEAQVKAPEGKPAYRIITRADGGLMVQFETEVEKVEFDRIKKALGQSYSGKAGALNVAPAKANVNTIQQIIGYQHDGTATVQNTEEAKATKAQWAQTLRNPAPQEDTVESPALRKRADADLDTLEPHQQAAYKEAVRLGVDQELTTMLYSGKSHFEIVKELRKRLPKAKAMEFVASFEEATRGLAVADVENASLRGGTRLHGYGLTADIQNDGSGFVSFKDEKGVSRTVTTEVYKNLAWRQEVKDEAIVTIVQHGGQLVTALNQYQKDVVSLLAELGAEVIYYEGGQNDPNGFYARNGRTLFINAASDRQNGQDFGRRVVFHEFLHMLEDTDDTLYKKLVDTFEKKISAESIATFREKVLKGKGGTDREVVMEMLSDEFANFASTEEFWIALRQENTELFEGMFHKLKVFFAKLRKIFGDGKVWDNYIDPKVVNEMENEFKVLVTRARARHLSGETMEFDFNETTRESLRLDEKFEWVHNTPHVFDAIDHSYMGAGEGAQLYGWGTYISSHPGTHNFYRNERFGKSINYKGQSLVRTGQGGSVRGKLDFKQYKGELTDIEKEVLEGIHEKISGQYVGKPEEAKTEFFDYIKNAEKDFTKYRKVLAEHEAAQEVADKDLTYFRRALESLRDDRVDTPEKLQHLTNALKEKTSVKYFGDDVASVIEQLDLEIPDAKRRAVQAGMYIRNAQSAVENSTRELKMLEAYNMMAPDIKGVQTLKLDFDFDDEVVMDWDAPLMEQTDFVKDAILGLYTELANTQTDFDRLALLRKVVPRTKATTNLLYKGRPVETSTGDYGQPTISNPDALGLEKDTDLQIIQAIHSRLHAIYNLKESVEIYRQEYAKDAKTAADTVKRMADKLSKGLIIEEVLQRAQGIADDRRERLEDLERVVADLRGDDVPVQMLETGQQYYKKLERGLNSDKAASLFLLDLGIKGHRFKDGFSRGDKKNATHNLVIYDDKAIKIMDRFSIRDVYDGKKGIIGFKFKEHLFYERGDESFMHKQGLTDEEILIAENVLYYMTDGVGRELKEAKERLIQDLEESGASVQKIAKYRIITFEDIEPISLKDVKQTTAFNDKTVALLDKPESEYGNLETPDGEEANVVEVADAIAELFHVDVKYFHAEPGVKALGFRKWEDARNVYLSDAIEDDYIPGVVGHEIFHHLRTRDKILYGDFMGFLRTTIPEDEAVAYVTNHWGEEYAGYYVTDHDLDGKPYREVKDGIYEEIGADMFGHRIRNLKTWKQLKAFSETLFGRIYDFLSHLHALSSNGLTSTLKDKAVVDRLRPHVENIGLWMDEIQERLMADDYAFTMVEPEGGKQFRIEFPDLSDRANPEVLQILHDNLDTAIYNLDAIWSWDAVARNLNYDAKMELVAQGWTAIWYGDENLLDYVRRVTSKAGREDSFIVTDDSVARNSVRTLDRENFPVLLEQLTAKGFEREKVEKYLKDMLTVADLVLADPARLDFKANPAFKSVKSNSDKIYKYSLDFSTLCKKRYVLQATLDAIQKEKGKALEAKEVMAVRQALSAADEIVSCGLCYVDASRLGEGVWYNQLVEEWEAQMVRKWSMMNFRVKKHVPEKAQARIKAIQGAFRKSRLKDTERAEIRKIEEKYWPKPSAELLAEIRSVDPKQLLTSAGRDRMAVSNPEVYNVVRTFVREKTHAKGVEGRTEYTFGDLQEVMTPTLVAMLKANAGMRWQSWSDFEVPHMLDAMQAIADMALLDLTGHAYTKVPEFVEFMGLTGMMLNLSVIAKGSTGFKKDGTLDFDDVEGMVFKEAMRLRDLFPDTAGTIAVGINDAHILAMMADGRIDYIIPYHISGLSGQLRTYVDGLADWLDYTSIQNEKGEADHPRLADWWDYNVSPDDNTLNYLRFCEEQGLSPKFEKFIKDEKGNVRKGAWKLLIDRKMVNHVTGEQIRQQVVSPTFDTTTMERIMANYSGDHQNAGRAHQATVDAAIAGTLPEDPKFISVADQKKKAKPTKLERLSERTPEFDKWFKGSKVVDANGEPLPMYHGAKADFTVIKPDGLGLYFLTTDPKFAEKYNTNKTTPPNKVMPLFAKAVNPVDTEKVSATLVDKIVEAHRSSYAEGISKAYENQLRNGIETGDWYWYEMAPSIETIKAEGYDGIWLWETDYDKERGARTLALFEPNQIKDVNNQSPTEDPDIRYSARGEDFTGTKYKPEAEWDELEQTLASIGAPPLTPEYQKYLADWTEKKRLQSMSMEEQRAEAKRIWQERGGDVMDLPTKATRAEYEGFRTDKTGTSYWDEFLTPEGLKYKEENKGLTGYVAEMSPSEYLDRIAKQVFKVPVEHATRTTDKEDIAKYAQLMKEGTKFDLPILHMEQGGETQEGRHRAMAAQQAGIDLIPVLVVKTVGDTRFSTRQPDSFPNKTFGKGVNADNSADPEGDVELLKGLNLDHEVYTNEKALEDAHDWLDEVGVEVAMNDFILNEKFTTLEKHHVVAAQILLKQAVAAGNKERMVRIAKAVGEKARTMGQANQALAMWSMLTPEGTLLRAVRLIEEARSEEENKDIKGKAGEIKKAFTEINVKALAGMNLNELLTRLSKMTDTDITMARLKLALSQPVKVPPALAKDTAFRAQGGHLKRGAVIRIPGTDQKGTVVSYDETTRSYTLRLEDGQVVRTAPPAAKYSVRGTETVFLSISADDLEFEVLEEELRQMAPHMEELAELDERKAAKKAEAEARKAEKEALRLEKAEAKAQEKIASAKDKEAAKAEAQAAKAEAQKAKAAEREAQKAERKAEAEAKKAEREHAERILANRVASTTVEKEATAVDPVRVMVNTLFKVAQQVLPKAETTRVSPEALAALAIQNRDEYKRVWEAAKDILEEELSPEGLEQIQPYLDMALRKSTSIEDNVRKAIKENLAELEIDIRKTVKEFYGPQTATRDLVSLLVSNSNLTGQEAEILASEIERQMGTLTATAKQKELDRIFAVKHTKRTDKLAGKDIAEIMNLGAFDGWLYKHDLPRVLAPKIKNAITQSGIDLTELVLQSHAEKGLTLSALTSALLADTGLHRELTKSEITALSRYIHAEVNALLAKRAGTKLKQMYAPKERKVTARQSATDRILKTANLGGFEVADFQEAIAEKLGLVAMSAALQQSVISQAEAIQAMEPGYDRDLASAVLLNTIAQEMPVTAWEKVNTFRNMAMLLNPVTLTRNVIGNGLFGYIDLNLVTRLATVIDREHNLYNKAVKKASDAGWKEGERRAKIETDLGVIVDTIKRPDMPKARTYRTGALGAANKALDKALRGMDMKAYYKQYYASLSEQMQLYNRTAKDKITSPTEDMVDNAHQLALYRTFQDETGMSVVFTGAKNLLNFRPMGDGPGTGVSKWTGGEFGVGSLVLPFVKTPSNLLMRAMDYSPLGFLLTLGRLQMATTQSPYMRAKLKSMGFARNIVGTGIFGIGIALYMLGIITGSGDDDDKEFTTDLGVGKYRVNLGALTRVLSGDFSQQKPEPGDLLVRYDWLLPVSVSLAMGADVADRLSRDWEGTNPVVELLVMLDSTWQANVSVLTEQAMLSQLSRVFSQGDIARGITNLVASSLASFIPSTVNRIGTAFDSTVRDTASDSTLVEGGLKALARTPGASMLLPGEVNELGKTRKYYDPERESGITTFAQRVSQLINPAIWDVYQPTDTEQLIVDLYRMSKDPTVVPDKLYEKKRSAKGADGEVFSISREDYQKAFLLVGPELDKALRNAIAQGIRTKDVSAQVLWVKSILAAQDEAIKQQLGVY